MLACDFFVREIRECSGSLLAAFAASRGLASRCRTDYHLFPLWPAQALCFAFDTTRCVGRPIYDAFAPAKRMALKSIAIALFPAFLILPHSESARSSAKPNVRSPPTMISRSAGLRFTCATVLA